MGLLVQSLENIPTSAKRDYFIYLLDYGWHEPISDALRNNFNQMADKAASSEAVIIRGTSIGFHFENEVLSWHHINNENTDELLPALLITNAHPAYFRDRGISPREAETNGQELKMILIPFKKICTTTTEVISIIAKVFKDIEEGKDLDNFQVAKELHKGVGKALADSLILEPNFAGVGFSFSKFIAYFKK